MNAYKEEITRILNEEKFNFKLYALLNYSAFQMIKSTDAKLFNAY